MHLNKNESLAIGAYLGARLQFDAAVSCMAFAMVEVVEKIAATTTDANTKSELERMAKCMGDNVGEMERGIQEMVAAIEQIESPNHG